MPQVGKSMDRKASRRRTDRELAVWQQRPQAGEVWKSRGYNLRSDDGATRWIAGETRHVVDRTYGGDVVYVSGRYRYESRCTLAEWRTFQAWAWEVKS